MKVQKVCYIHDEIPELSVEALDNGKIYVVPGHDDDPGRSLEVALATMKLAERIGILPVRQAGPEGLPYTDANDNLLFSAPLTSALFQKRCSYLRGWKQFDSCVKGFNSLGLMAEHILQELGRFERRPVSEVDQLKRKFLSSRLVPDGGPQETHPVFSRGEIEGLSQSDLQEINLFDLATWGCFAQRTIVCSTSSNMGISLHQALRLMQKLTRTFRGKPFTSLNRTEGSLVIWCPDERADFMNREKTTLLRALEDERPKLTKLRTYINRQQRDPGALKDALIAGGFFFPTNPQSAEELQQLLFVALNDLARERGTSLEEIVRQDPNVCTTLNSLGCRIEAGTVIIQVGVEGGIHGLMIPYLILLNEFLRSNSNLGKSVAAWNQASIGAALAAAALADRMLRSPETLPDRLRRELSRLFPVLGLFLETSQLGRGLETRIHGVFDVANLQSLAQLLGVVVKNHLSGRGTAYVGLGSSSYSNGNRCFEILLKSSEDRGAFRGKAAFHPATHAVNPFAQAIIFGEDLFRFLRHRRLRGPIDAHTLRECRNHTRKPEAAGAAALAGYLLARLDMRTLSVVEVAYMLRLVGFTRERFLEFAGYAPDGDGGRTFLQQAREEGQFMEALARHMLLLLDWSVAELRRVATTERIKSKLRYQEAPIDDATFEDLNGETCLYLTGDNTQQPSDQLVEALAETCVRNQGAIAQFLTDGHGIGRRHSQGDFSHVSEHVLGRPAS
jgi:hypothetical protein